MYIGQVFVVGDVKWVVMEIRLADGSALLSSSSSSSSSSKSMTLLELAKSECVWDNCDGISLDAIR